MEFATRKDDSKCICTFVEEDQDHQDQGVNQDHQVHQDNQDQVGQGEEQDQLARLDLQGKEENLVLKATKDPKDHLVRTQQIICVRMKRFVLFYPNKKFEHTYLIYLASWKYLWN